MVGKMSGEPRDKWLAELRLNDPVVQVKTTIVKTSGYIDQVLVDNGFLVGEKIYDRNGEIKGHFGTLNYRLEVPSPENAYAVKRRQTINWFHKIRWDQLNPVHLDQLEAVYKTILATPTGASDK